MVKEQSLKTLKWYIDNGVKDALSEEPVGLYHAKKLDQKPAKPFKEPIAPVSKAPVASKRPAAVPLSLPSAQTLEELKTFLEAYEGCQLKSLATNTVFADGNPKARVMFVGEAPGADEDRLGKPFVGLSGQLLDKILQSVGLSRETNAYISNIVSWRPPGNRQPTTEEIVQCLPFIKRHIELINPQILVFVGGVAAKSLLETNTGIMRLRGQWHSYSSPGLEKPIPAMATLHPAYLLRSPGQKALVWRDFLKIKRALENNKF